MPLEEKTRPAKPHELHLDGRKRLTVSAVEEVIAFDEKEVYLRTAGGLLCVRGEELKVERLDKGSGDFVLTGSVSELVYPAGREGGGLWRRLWGG